MRGGRLLISFILEGQWSFWVRAQPIRDDVTMLHHSHWLSSYPKLSLKTMNVILQSTAWLLLTWRCMWLWQPHSWHWVNYPDRLINSLSPGGWDSNFTFAAWKQAPVNITLSISSKFVFMQIPRDITNYQPTLFIYTQLKKIVRGMGWKPVARLVKNKLYTLWNKYKDPVMYKDCAPTMANSCTKYVQDPWNIVGYRTVIIQNWKH